ncbi:MarR family transcriptional regulator [Psychrobacillus sp.]|uniref:MarR family winged helix-turn-helix transcriptional regulator n=1 Tax=Psychrobacillus sp. TaxID=1871623 RepID=UPI0028BDC458|nr:MarR family transcriptional regulator [Psychrobacillus sp.]
MEQNTLSSLIWLRMARFVQRSNQLSNEFLERYDMTVAQFDVLAQIHIYEPITQMDLAEKLTVSSGGISRMLTRLEKECLIVRKQDWKIKYISLTDKGRALIQDAMPEQTNFQSSLFDEVLDETEKKQLYTLMTKIQKNSLQKKI